MHFSKNLFPWCVTLLLFVKYARHFRTFRKILSNLLHAIKYIHTQYTQRGEIDTHTMLGYLKTMSSLCDPSGSLSAQPSKLQNKDNVTAEVPEAA